MCLYLLLGNVLTQKHPLSRLLGIVPGLFWIFVLEFYQRQLISKWSSRNIIVWSRIRQRYMFHRFGKNRCRILSTIESFFLMHRRIIERTESRRVELKVFIARHLILRRLQPFDNFKGFFWMLTILTNPQKRTTAITCTAWNISNTPLASSIWSRIL